MSSKPELFQFRNIAPLNMQPRERYLPSAFDESLSIIERINKIIYYINEIYGLTGEVIAKWNEIMEWVLGNGLNEAVVDQLQKWVEDGTLKEIINEEIFADLNKEIQSLKVYVNESMNTLNEISVKESEPTYVANLNLKIGTIMQSFQFNGPTNEFYAIQTNGYLPGPAQGYTMNRLSPGGIYMDSMDVVYGGHGVSFGIENIGNQVYIWSYYQKVDANGNAIGHELIRYPYMAGATITPTSPSVQRYSTFQNGPFYPAVDQANDIMAFRLGTEGVQRIEIRKLSDVKNGVNKVLHSFAIPPELLYLQGMAVFKDRFYWLTGDSNGVNYPIELTEFDVTTGRILSRRRLNYGKNDQGQYDANFREPEGLSFYYDPVTGGKSLLLGIITDSGNRRQNKVYAFNSVKTEGFFASVKSQSVQNIPLTTPSGNTKELPAGATALIDIQEPGLYYLTTADSERFKDHPLPGVAGWYLEVHAPYYRNNFRQVLTRVSVHPHNNTEFTKLYNGTGDGSGWVQTQGAPLWKNVPLGGSVTGGNPTLQAAFSRGKSEVSLRGFVNLNGASSFQQLIGTLPEELRPNQWQYIPVKTDADRETTLVVIKSDGRMELYQNATSGTRLYFYGITFFTN